MKKIILILLLPIFLFSQEKSSDVVDLTLLDFYKSKDVETYEYRDLFIEQTNMIMKRSSDSIVIKKCKEYLDYLSKVKTIEGINVDLSKASKEDLKLFYTNDDKYLKTKFLRHRKLDSEQIRLSIQIKNNKALILMKVNYISNDWLFLKYLTFLVGEDQININLKEVERNVNLGSINETSSFYVNDEIMQNLEKIIQSPTRIDFRFSGDKGYNDSFLTLNHIKKLKEVIDFVNKIKI